MSKFQPVNALFKTKVLTGDFLSDPWAKWMNLIPLRLTSPVTNDAPATSTSAGIQGEIRQDGSFLYVCTDTNTWKRIALSAF